MAQPPKITKSPKKMYDYSGLSPGMTVQVEDTYECPGTYFAAEVVQVSEAKNRSKAPVKVSFKGYANVHDEWVGGDRIRSKALQVVSEPPAKPQATRGPGAPPPIVKKQPKKYDYSGLSPGMILQVEDTYECPGTYFTAEVVQVSEAKNRSKAPVKVSFKGAGNYPDEWIGGERIRSKALKVVSEPGADPGPRKATARAPAKQAKAVERASKVFCEGPLLHAVQISGIFADGKHFVDMPMKVDPEEILKKFAALTALGEPSNDDLRKFVAEFFDEPGADLIPHTPEEFPAEPPLKRRVQDPSLQEFLHALHGLWPTLIRTLNPKVLALPHRHSAIPRQFPVVLPGGRFRETYYWDSYWTVEGLLASGLLETAVGLASNLLDDVERFGFVPNGGRIYYLNRSQPPMLCDMVASIARAMAPPRAQKWLATAVPILQKENQYWMRDSSKKMVHVGSSNGKEYYLNRYYANLDTPRPESYREDFETASGNKDVYREIASGAETGWDFSSRWYRTGVSDDSLELKDTATTLCVPVDLNSMLYRAEKTLAAMTEAVSTGETLSMVEGRLNNTVSFLSDPTAKALMSQADLRREAMDLYLWNDGAGRWADKWQGHESASLENRVITLADFTPLWAGLASLPQARKAVVALQQSGLIGEGGVATTNKKSGQQWDAPNSWPPLQAMLIEGLRSLDDSTGGPALAAKLAQAWVGTCYVAWRKTGFMHEKYNSEQFGFGGAGGEYEPQVGFGWSNGSVLQLFRDYGAELVAPESK